MTSSPINPDLRVLQYLRSVRAMQKVIRPSGSQFCRLVALLRTFSLSVSKNAKQRLIKKLSIVGQMRTRIV